MGKQHIPTIEYHGPVATHDQSCAVYHHLGAPAVLNMSRGVFEPSWEAQKDGWHLIHARTLLQRLLLRFFK